MKMDVVEEQELIGALSYKSAFNLGRRLVLLKMVKRLRVALSLHVLTEGAVHQPTTNAPGQMKITVLSLERFTLLV